MTDKQIEDKIYILEHEKMEYLEVDDKANANRKRREIEKLQQELELRQVEKLKNENRCLKEFIYKMGLNQRYVDYVDNKEK